jgi:hypothetical protein
MKLVEFFSKNTDDGQQKDKLEDDFEKDLMGFILDDNDIYKEHLFDLEQDRKKGKKITPDDYAEVVKQCCIKYYKDQELNTDPNKLFSKEIRKSIASKLCDLGKEANSKKKEKDEDKTPNI